MAALPLIPDAPWITYYERYRDEYYYGVYEKDGEEEDEDGEEMETGEED